MKNKQKNNKKNKSFMIIIGLYSKGHFKTKENILKSKGIYSWKTTEVNIQGEEISDLNAFKSLKLRGDYYIFKNNYEKFFDVKGVLLSDIQKYTTVQGRFLTKSECKSNSKKAVIGKNVKSQIYKIDNTPFINICNQKFEIIGILKNDINIKLADTVIIPFQAALELYGINGQYAIDGDVKNITQVVTILKDNGVTEIISPKTDIFSSLTEFYQKNNDILHVYLLLFISIIFLLVLSMEYCLINFEKEYKIYMTLGFSNRILFLLFIKMYFKLILISTISSAFFTEIIVKVCSDSNIYIISIILSFILDFLIILGIVTKKILRMRGNIWK
ncbi:ABC transporter permease [Lachnoclostridium sp. An181]|uniref:ABC transporter permease n=1 Tax=Lachnoclostridium sp. An181 TaxID=1965575 RepID=UPI000B390E94|nr:ABC transporter permease [Lachnoclostridium sp. An181]OUP51350.1 hypothetical protein B5F18_01165 [Lachnoclostridium sp. An181]